MIWQQLQYWNKMYAAYSFCDSVFSMIFVCHRLHHEKKENPNVGLCLIRWYQFSCNNIVE